jgi:tetratricopeptide (TPR) repeat protein
MSESLFGGILGEEDEKPEDEAPEAMAGAEAFAAAVAAIASRQDPGVARDTSAFLRDQSALLRTQQQHLEHEHSLRLSILEGQKREGDLRRAGIRVRIAFQLFFAIVAGCIGLGAIVMVRDALASRSVVIDSFEIAPNVAAQLPSGRIVAAGLLDVLTRIQSATRSSADHRSLSNAWTNDIEIDLPETGVSIGKLERVLKQRLGHDLHIDGDLVATAHGGLALTVRGTGIMPKTFADEGRDVDKLVNQAGEYVFGQSQPGLWTAYLGNNNRNDDAIRFAQSAYMASVPGERPYILNYWANALSAGGPAAMEEALRMYRETIRLKPDFWIGYSNEMFALVALGREEEAVEAGRQLIKAAGGRPGRATGDLYQNYDTLIWDLAVVKAELIADIDAHGGVGTTTYASGAENLTVAATDVQLHDPESAELRLRSTRVDPSVMPDVALAALARALLAEEAGDFKRAAAVWDEYRVAYADPAVAAQNPQQSCWSAGSYQRTGQPSKADAALAAVGALTFTDCERFRADVLDLRGDWAGAQAWYAKAAKLAPSVPTSYYSWGLALARHGDLDGAAAKFEAANRAGPHWADPLKAWGDVLAKQGRRTDALARYDAALKYAPNWKQLKNARETAATHAS